MNALRKLLRHLRGLVSSARRKVCGLHAHEYALRRNEPLVPTTQLWPHSRPDSRAVSPAANALGLCTSEGSRFPDTSSLPPRTTTYVRSDLARQIAWLDPETGVRIYSYHRDYFPGTHVEALRFRWLGPYPARLRLKSVGQDAWRCWLSDLGPEYGWTRELVFDVFPGSCYDLWIQKHVSGDPGGPYWFILEPSLD